ncbi:MAG: 50S ribosomal protein L6 [Spirochaetes bacterium]|nr:50S ribosomal protein L6 [Spirochaetota bacterium]
MSRIGKQPITIPEKVEFTQEGSKIILKGPKGTLEMDLPFEGEITKNENQVVITGGKENNASSASYGLVRALINNMVIGVSEGFTKTLKIAGVGYKAQLKGNILELNLGFSHTVEYAIPEGITVDVQDGTTIVVAGIDKQAVGQVATDIRRFKPPEPYKGKGIMYSTETVRKKAGKTAVK